MREKINSFTDHTENVTENEFCGVVDVSFTVFNLSRTIELGS